MTRIITPTIDGSATTLGQRFVAAAPGFARGLALTYGLLAPLVVLPFSQTEFASAVDLLAPLCFIVVVLGGRLDRLRISHVLMLAWWAAALVSLLPIRDPLLAQGGLLRWLRLVALGAPLFLGLATNHASVVGRQVLKAFVWGGLAAIVAGLVVYWLQVPIHPDQQRLYFEGGAEPMFRAGGLAGNTGIFGHLVATWAVLALGLSRGLVAPWRRELVGMAVLSLSVYTIAVCSSRSALLNLGVSCIAGFCLLDAQQRREAALDLFNIILISIVLLAIPAMLLLEYDSEALQTSLQRFVPGERRGLDDYASGRLENWSLYLGEVESHPYLGAGYKTGYLKFHARAPDNSAISILYETGLLGLIAAVGFVLAVVIPLGVRGARGDPFARLLAAAWIGQLAHGLTADIYTFWQGMPVMYLLTGLALAQPAEPVAKHGTR